MRARYTNTAVCDPGCTSIVQPCSKHPFTLAAWFLFECLSILTYGNSQVSSLVATALYAAFYAFLRCSLLRWYEDNKVSSRRAHSDLFQFPLVCQSASNVVVLGSHDSLHWGGMHCPLQNSAMRLGIGSLLEEAGIHAHLHFWR